MAVIPGNSHQGPLAPKYNLSQDTRDPSNKPEKLKFRRSYKWVPIAVFFLASLVAIPLTMSQLSTQQDIRQRASEVFPTQVIASPTPFPTDTPTASPSVTFAPSVKP